MSIVKIGDSEVINLNGFDIDGEILLSDDDTMDNYKKVVVILPKDYLEFLITDRGLLDDLDVKTTVW